MVVTARGGLQVVQGRPVWIEATRAALRRLRSADNSTCLSVVFRCRTRQAKAVCHVLLLLLLMMLLLLLLLLLLVLLSSTTIRSPQWSFRRTIDHRGRQS